MVQCVLSGMINGFGFILVNYSTTTGIAGPAAALVNVQTLLHTVMSAVILNQAPGLQQTLAMVVGVVGSLLIT